MRTPSDIVTAGATRAPHKIALVTPGRTLTYGDLDALSDRVASGLLARGVRPREVVSLYSANRWELIVAYHGVLKAGCVVNPLNALLTPAEVAYVTGDCGAVAILGSGERLATLAGVRGELSGVRELIAFDAPPAGAVDWQELVERPADELPPVQVDPLDACSIGYTSGTTGHPKGAVQPYRGIVLNAAMTATMHGRNAADVLISALPAPHVYGTVVINSTLIAGGTVVLLERFEADAVLAAIQEHRATMFEGVPTMYAGLLACPELEGADLSTLQRCTVAGQTMPPDTLREWQERSGATMIDLWGMTEVCGGITSQMPYGPRTPGSSGRTYPACELRVASLEDRDVPAAPGEAGELQVRGPLLMTGYHGNEEATARAISPDGWYRTGDVGTVDASGEVFVLDRIGDMIITAGYNIYPAELERVIAGHPAVSMVGVGSTPDAVKGELARAYIVLRPGATATEAEIVEHCRGELAAYKLPRSVRFVEDLPRTSSGKIMRRELGQLDAGDAAPEPVG